MKWSWNGTTVSVVQLVESCKSLVEWNTSKMMVIKQ